MRWLPARHGPVRLGGGSPGFLAPDQQRHGDEQNRKAKYGNYDVQVEESHPADPRRKSEEDNHRKGIARENNTNQCVADDLSVNSQSRYLQNNGRVYRLNKSFKRFGHSQHMTGYSHHGSNP